MHTTTVVYGDEPDDIPRSLKFMQSSSYKIIYKLKGSRTILSCMHLLSSCNDNT